MKASQAQAEGPSATPHFILIKRSGPDAQGIQLGAEAAARRLLDARCWPLWSRTRNRKAIQAGSKVAVYLAGPGLVVATGVVAKVEPWSDGHRRSYPLTLDGVPVAMLMLDQVHELPAPVTVKTHLKDLTFIDSSSPKWGVAFMGGTRAVSAEDFAVLTGARAHAAAACG